jgi:hypothetical protein
MRQGTAPATNVSGLVNVLIEIGKRRAAALEKMRAAFERNDVATILDHARYLCGLTSE